MNRRCVKLRVSYHSRYSLCSGTAIFFLWWVLLFTYLLCHKYIWFLFAGWIDKCEVEVRVYFLPAFSPLTWLSCVSYCHLLTRFGINMLFIKYVVDIVSQFWSEEKCFIEFVSVVIIDIKLRSIQSRTPAVACGRSTGIVPSQIHRSAVFENTTNVFQYNVCNIFNTCVPRFCVCNRVVLNRRKFTSCFVQFSCFDVTSDCPEDDRWRCG